MKQNNIETAREFYLHKAQMQPDIEELQMMVLYANYLNSDSEGTKSAERILFDTIEEGCHEKGSDRLDAPIKDIIKAMHEFSAQSRPQLTDEEIKKEVIRIGSFAHWSSRDTAIAAAWNMAQWMLSKMTGK